MESQLANMSKANDNVLIALQKRLFSCKLSEKLKTVATLIMAGLKASIPSPLPAITIPALWLGVI
jgi:hypothetical protein